MENDNINFDYEADAEDVLEKLSLKLQRDSRRYTAEIDYTEG